MSFETQGHVRSLTLSGAPPGKVLAVVSVSIIDTSGADLELYVPVSEAAEWVPGQIIQITIEPV